MPRLYWAVVGVDQGRQMTLQVVNHESTVSGESRSGRPVPRRVVLFSCE